MRTMMAQQPVRKSQVVRQLQWRVRPEVAQPAHDPAEADPAEADPAEADPAEADPAEADLTFHQLRTGIEMICSDSTPSSRAVHRKVIGACESLQFTVWDQYATADAPGVETFVCDQAIQRANADGKLLSRALPVVQDAGLRFGLLCNSAQSCDHARDR